MNNIIIKVRTANEPVSFPLRKPFGQKEAVAVESCQKVGSGGRGKVAKTDTARVSAQSEGLVRVAIAHKAEEARYRNEEEIA